MSMHGPFHRRGGPGGPGCRVGVLAVKGKAADGTAADASLLDAGPGSNEIELLRTVAHGLGVTWGQDELGWWAAVPATPTSQFAASHSETENIAGNFALYRTDDNGVTFLVAEFHTREEAERRASELARGGHKQHYFVEQNIRKASPISE